MQHHLRSVLKYQELTDAEDDKIQSIQDKFFEILSEHNVDLNEFENE